MNLLTMTRLSLALSCLTFFSLAAQSASPSLMRSSYVTRQEISLFPHYTQDIKLPDLGTAASESLSETEEREWGQKLMADIERDPAFLPDPELTDYLNTVAHRLLSYSPKPTQFIHVFPLKDPELNAFAMPGGFIAVNTGTLLAAKNESELAGVLGHEIGHVTQRHIARMLENQRQQALLTMGGMVLGVLAGVASQNDQVGAALITSSQAASIQQSLNFSQSAEREADRVGLSTLIQAGYEPDGLKQFFLRLARTHGPHTLPSRYLSTHPLTEARLADMDTRLTDQASLPAPESLNFALMKVRARFLTLKDSRARQEWQKELEQQTQSATHTMIEKEAAWYGLALLHIEARNLSGTQVALRHLVYRRTNLYEGRLYTLWLLANQKNREAFVAAAQLEDEFPFSKLAAVTAAQVRSDTQKDKALLEGLHTSQAINETDPVYFEILAKHYAKTPKTKSLFHYYTGRMMVLQGEDVNALRQFELARQANDGTFYTMSQIDAMWRQTRQRIREAQKRD